MTFGTATLEVSFGKCTCATDVPKKKGTPNDLPVSGREYQSDGKVIVSKEGAPLPFAEEHLVLEWTRPLLPRAALAEPLAGKTLKKGESVEVPQPCACLVLEPLSLPLPGGTTRLTLADERTVDGQECAVFQVAASIVHSGNAQFGSRVTLEVTGEMVVTKLHCLVVSAKLEGEFTQSDAKSGSGKGAPNPSRKPAEKGSKVKGLGKETLDYHARVE